MKSDSIKYYKPGRITLYNRKTDPYFRGSLVIKTTKKTKAKSEKNPIRADILTEVLRENFSQNLDAVIQSLHIKTAQSGIETAAPKVVPAESETPTTEELLKIQNDEPEVKPKPEEPEEKDSDLFKKKPPFPENKPKTSKVSKILKEYSDLLDFPALFKFIFHTASSVYSAGLEKLKSGFEKHFYTENQKAPVKPVARQQASSLTGIYRSFEREISGNLSKIRVNKNFQTFLKGAAITCLLLSLLSFMAVILPLVAAQIGPKIILNQKPEEIIKVENDYPNATPNNIDPSSFVPTAEDFSISIPAIDLVSGISPYVDLSKELEYKEELLKTGVAHAKDSYLPGEGGPVFLFAHSTDSIFNIARFNAKFFYAKDLKPGDEIKIDFKGKTYKYLITGSTIIAPQEIETVRESNSDLILMTCTPPGTDWQRLIIFADEVNGQ